MSLTGTSRDTLAWITNQYGLLLKSSLSMIYVFCAAVFSSRGDRTSSDNASWARTVHARTTAFDTPLSAVTQAEECPCQTHARWRTAGGAVRMSPRWLLVYSRGAAHKAQRQCALVTAPTPPHAHGAAALLWSRRHNQPELLVSSVDVDRLRARPVFASRSWGRGRGGCHKSPGDICWGASRIDDSRNSWRRPGLLAHAAPGHPAGWPAPISGGHTAFAQSTLLPYLQQGSPSVFITNTDRSW